MTGRVSPPGNTASRAPAFEAAQQSERLAWSAYCRVIALQWAEPSAETAVIRRAVFKVWEHAFLADERGAA